MSILFLLFAAGLWFVAMAALDHDARKRRVIAARLQPACAAQRESTCVAPPQVVQKRRPRLLGFAAMFTCQKCQQRYYFGPSDFVSAAHGDAAAQRLRCCAGESLHCEVVAVTRDLLPRCRSLLVTFGDEPGIVVKAKGAAP